MNKTTKIVLIVVAALALIALAVWTNRDSLLPFAFKPTETALPNIETPVPPAPSEDNPAEQVVAENLKVPWEIAFLPDGQLLVTERPGNLVRVSPDRKTLTTIAGVAHVGEGGLMGMALHPKFAENRRIYLYLTTRENGALKNRVESYRLENDQLSDRKTVLEGIPGSSNHDGGRIAFGPDGFLYITTGDAEVSSNAQDKNSLAGKILRVTDEGGIPSDNPFGNAVYSYGHRNPQGLAWDSTGRLWATEHGPSGTQTGHDELNLIEKGANYGWPNIRGDQTSPGMKTPVVNSGSSETWAPAGLMSYSDLLTGGVLVFTGLRGESLYVGGIGEEPGDKPVVDLFVHLRDKYGRLRAITLGPDGYIYVSTSNTDGRGRTNKGDDKIIKLNPRGIFQKWY